MPLGKVQTNVQPPSEKVASESYGPLYEALYAAKPETWISVEIEHPAGPAKKQEIANVRRAAQRWFELDANKNVYHMVSQVTSVDATHSVMFIKKEAKKANGKVDVEDLS